MAGPPGPCGCGCALSPETSVGFDQDDFARDVLRHPYDPWQRFSVIHAGELLPDGRERFRYRLIVVARQNGKSEIVVVLAPYWMFVERVAQILATSTKLPMAKKLWKKSRLLIEGAELDKLLGRRWYREANGEIEMFAPPRTAKGEPWGSSYAIDASNEEGGRSLSVNRLALDELRQHTDYSAWGASVRTMGAIEDAQAWLLSNAGSDRSVVLNNLRDSLVEELPDGTEYVPHDPDTDTFLAEWSTPRNADPLDVYALAQANPNMNRRGQKAKDLLADARRAVKTGGEALAEFQTEVMCVRVRVLNPAIDLGKWALCLDPGDLDDARSRIALCLDLAPDGLHATLAAAAVLEDDRVRVEIVEAWDGPTCVDQLRKALPGLVDQVRPQVLGWLPSGPGAAFAADMAVRQQGDVARRWPPWGVDLVEIKSELPAVCMGFDEQVRAKLVAHSADPMLDKQLEGAERLKRGDMWVFSRRGETHVDGLYAAAGAAHLARTLPPPVGGLRIVVSD